MKINKFHDDTKAIAKTEVKTNVALLEHMFKITWT